MRLVRSIGTGALTIVLLSASTAGAAVSAGEPPAAAAAAPAAPQSGELPATGRWTGTINWTQSYSYGDSANFSRTIGSYALRLTRPGADDSFHFSYPHATASNATLSAVSRDTPPGPRPCITRTNGFWGEVTGPRPGYPYIGAQVTVHDPPPGSGQPATYTVAPLGLAVSGEITTTRNKNCNSPGSTTDDNDWWLEGPWPEPEARPLPANPRHLVGQSSHDLPGGLTVTMSYDLRWHDTLTYRLGHRFTAGFAKRGATSVSGYDYIHLDGTPDALARVDRVCVRYDWSAVLKKPSASTVPGFWAFHDQPSEPIPSEEYQAVLNTAKTTGIRRLPGADGSGFCVAGPHLVLNKGRGGAPSLYVVGNRDALRGIPIIGLSHGATFTVRFVSGAVVRLQSPGSRAVVGLPRMRAASSGEIYAR